MDWFRANSFLAMVAVADCQAVILLVWIQIYDITFLTS